MDPLATQHRHERLIQREEIRRLASVLARYFDVPHLFYDGVTTETFGVGPFPVLLGDSWLMPAGAWLVRSAFSTTGALGDRALAYIRARRGGLDNDQPKYEAYADYVSTGSNHLGGSDDTIEGQLELGPLVSDGTLAVWSSLPGDSLIVFARLSRP